MCGISVFLHCGMFKKDVPPGSRGGKCFTHLSSLHLYHYQVLSIALIKKFIWAFLLNVMEKPKQTFWPTQYCSCSVTSVVSDSL